MQLRITIPGSYSVPPSPTSSRLGQALGGSTSDSPSLRALELDSEPEESRVESEADPATPSQAAAPAPLSTGVCATGTRAAVLGALLSGAQQFLSELMGTVSRAGLQASLLVWAGRAWQPTSGASGGGGPPAGDATGGDSVGSDDPGVGSHDGDWGNRSTVSNETDPEGAWPGDNGTLFSNETIFDNRAFIGNDTFIGDPLNTTSPVGAGAGSRASPSRPDLALGPAGVLAGWVASTQASLVPLNASLPILQALPGDAFGGTALPGYEVRGAALAGPVALASAIVAVSVLLSACRVYELSRGAVSALTGRCRQPDSPAGARLGQALTGTLGLALAATPVLIALGRDSVKAHGPQERSMLAVWLLINLAGRTCKHLLRDVTTQLTRPHMPMLRYQVPLDQGRASLETGDGFAPADLGSPAFRELYLDRRFIATRAALMFTSYWAGIYFCMHYVLPAIRQAGGFADPVTLRDQIARDHSFGHVLAASVPALLTSALIEGLDSLTSSLSTSSAAAARGARIELVPGKRSETVARDFLDHFSTRIFNALFTVDLERGGNALRGIDRDTEPGMFLQGFALGLTDIRGFLVQFGQHGRAEAHAAALEEEPASQAEVLPAGDPLIEDESGPVPAPDPRIWR